MRAKAERPVRDQGNCAVGGTEAVEEGETVVGFHLYSEDRASRIS